MSCKKLSQRARDEQDFWLLYAPYEPEPTLEQRLEFLQFDSHGGTAPMKNPIYIGKCRYGMWGEFYRDWRFNDTLGWCGVDVLGEQPLRALIDWFDRGSVEDWASALLWNLSWY